MKFTCAREILIFCGCFFFFLEEYTVTEQHLALHAKEVSLQVVFSYFPLLEPWTNTAGGVVVCPVVVGCYSFSPYDESRQRLQAIGART